MFSSFTLAVFLSSESRLSVTSRCVVVRVRSRHALISALTD